MGEKNMREEHRDEQKIKSCKKYSSKFKSQTGVNKCKLSKQVIKTVYQNSALWQVY